MSFVVNQLVVRAWLVRERAHRHKGMTSVRELEELKTSAEVFFKVFVYIRNYEYEEEHEHKSDLSIYDDPRAVAPGAQLREGPGAL